jgi:phospholipid/cholesterol/gamma-HCH transport system permease protein
MTTGEPSILKLEADIELDGTHAYCVGRWTVAGIAGLEKRLAQLQWPTGKILLNGARIGNLDTTGAWLLTTTLAALKQAGHDAELVKLRPQHEALVNLVIERQRAAHQAAQPRPKPLGLIAWLGKRVWDKVEHGLGLLAFLGETVIAFGKTLIQPNQLRWRALFANLERAGLDAVPIVGLLSFLIGVVVAYQGGVQLKLYGANIFIVELVSLTMLRELAPLLTAIIVAGRTGSSFAAQIGTMKLTEEIDALRVIGISPFSVLVLPKLLSLCIALPLLTLFADIMSLVGGMVVASLLLDVSFTDFINRIPQVVTLFSFLFGILKAPVFATVIALVGCYQGFQVRGGADSVGRQTTESVVQAIFLVIIADALFAVFLGTKGLY